MASTDQQRVWYYLDLTLNQQKGPIPTNVLLRLLEKGISGIGATTMVWKEGMEKWLMMSEVEEFKSMAELQSKQWYYMDQENAQKGPIFTRLLLHKIKEGELDGYTLVFGSHLKEWTKLSEIPELKTEIQKMAEEEERAEEMKRAFLQQSESESELVYPSTENTDALLESFAKDLSAEQNDKNEKKEKQTFTADDGKRYQWDEEEDCWVLDSENEEEEDGNGENDNHRKRKAADLEDFDDHPNDHASEGEAEEGEEQDQSEEKKDSLTSSQPLKKKRKNKKRKNKQPNTWIYITGLPPNVTEEEIKDHFSKVGIIALNPLDQQPKIKIYREESDATRCKGDALLCYNAMESVQLAVEILDGGYLRPNSKISVSRATFDHHGPSTQTATASTATGKKNSSSSSSISHAQVKVAKNAIRQALAWNEDDDIGIIKSSALKIIVLEGMFTLEEIASAGPSEEAQDRYIEELEKDIVEEVAKIGEIEKVTMFTKNPKGILIIKFATAFAAQECIRMMNGRYFSGRKIKCYFWDGVTNYSIVPQALLGSMAEEEEKKEEERLNEFGDWLDHEQEELPEEFALQTEQ